MAGSLGWLRGKVLMTCQWFDKALYSASLTMITAIILSDAVLSNVRSLASVEPTACHEQVIRLWNPRRWCSVVMPQPVYPVIPRLRPRNLCRGHEGMHEFKECHGSILAHCSR